MTGDERRAMLVSTHSRLKAAADNKGKTFSEYRVSTHSRLKAAAMPASK